MNDETTEDASLSDQIASLRSDFTALDKRVTGVEAEIPGLRGYIDAKHQENRHSIHELRNGQQDIEDKVDGVTVTVHGLDIKFARATGYLIGAGAVTGLVVSGIGIIINHLWK